jgi:tetratricopeptide (TPR) repeat protein
MHADSCEATRVRKEQSEELLDLRGQCLRERREELRATVDALAKADLALVGSAQTVASGLTPLEQCADAAALRGRRRVPADPKTRAMLDDEAARLAEGRALYRAGNLDAAGQIAAAGLVVARATSDRALAATAGALQGSVLLQRGQWLESEAALEKATIDAAASRAESEEADAWTQLVRVRAELHHPEAARAAAAYAHAFADRADDDGLRARVLTQEAIILEYDADFEGAIRLQQRGLEIRRRVYGDRSFEVATMQAAIANELVQLNRGAEAADVATQALERFEAAVGPSHTSFGDSLNTRANAYAELGRLSEARADAERALGILQRVAGEDSEHTSSALLTLGELLCRQGDDEGAVARYSAGLRLKERALGADDAGLTDVLDALTEPLLHLGRTGEALALADRALTIAAAHYAPDHEFMAWPLHAAGAARVAMGKYAEGIPQLERALTLRLAHDDAEGTAATELALGRALYESGKDRKRGAELVRAAHDGFAAVGSFRQRDRAEAEALLARWK